MKQRRDGQRRENKKKAEERLKLRSSEVIVKLIRLTPPERSENLSGQELISPDCFDISTEELEQFDATKLKPRSHLHALETMIEQEMFEDRSKATMIKDNLSKMALTTSDNNKKRMKELKKPPKKDKAEDLVCCWSFSVLISVY